MVDPKKRVAVLGLGFIGLPLAAALANVGFKVIGVDLNQKKLSMLKEGKVPFYEPGLRDSLEKHRENIEYTSNNAYAINNSEVIFVAVGTPLRDNDEVDYTQLDSCIKEIGLNLRKGHLIILKPTLILGTTEDYVTPRLEELSGLKAGEDFYLAFCPERTIEGATLFELYTLPKILGGINKESALRAEKIIRKLGGKITIVSSPRVAEMCKLVDNTYRATNIAFANEIGMICENAGIKASEVVSTANNSYLRTKIFNPGLGADGPCLSKDPLIFKHSASKYNTPTPVTDGCIIQNKKSTLRVVDLIKDFLLKHNLYQINLAMIGVAFKGLPETDDARDSSTVKILAALKKDNVRINSIKLYDPLIEKFEDNDLSNSITEAVDGAEVILFMTNHPRIMNIELEDILKNTRRPTLIIDVWGNLIFDKIPEGVDYFRIGDASLH